MSSEEEPSVQAVPARPVDYRQTRVARRQSWFGLKGHVKRLLGLRVPHAAMRASLRFFPEIRDTGRLPAPASLREVHGFAGSGSFVMLRPDRCEVAKELYWGKGRRPQPRDRFAVELFSALAEQSDVVVDVGAYTGIFTLAATSVNPQVQVHAFEIAPEVSAALRENCARNDILARTTLHQAGVGAPGGSMKLPESTGGSALPSYLSKSTHFDDGVDVPFVSLDSLLEAIPSEQRVLMKVDVEGTEDAVFRHGQRFLSAHRPDILCEVLDGVANVTELSETLSPHGYAFYLVRDADIQARQELATDPAFRDWLFTIRTPDELKRIGIPITGGSAVSV